MNSKLKIAIIFALFLGFFSCAEEKQNEEQEVVRPVKYIQVFKSNEMHSRTFSGVSQSGRISRLSFRVGGKIEKINVKEGDKTNQGELIAVLDDSDAKLRYEKMLASLNRSQVYRKTAESNLERLKSLYENNNISLNEYEAAKDNFANANATWLADKRNAELQKRELGYYKLTAPVSGIVSNKSAEEGENIKAGQVFLEIQSFEKMEISSGIPEIYISSVQKGDLVEIQFNSIKDKVFNGEVTEVSYSLDSKSSTYPVKIKILHPTKKIRPGMPADVRFDFKNISSGGHLMVPVHSVGEDSSGNFVYILKPDANGLGIVEKRIVQTGGITDRGFEIISGVKGGEFIVTAGISKLSNGLKVRFE